MCFPNYFFDCFSLYKATTYCIIVSLNLSCACGGWTGSRRQHGQDRWASGLPSAQDGIIMTPMHLAEACVDDDGWATRYSEKKDCSCENSYQLGVFQRTVLVQDLALVRSKNYAITTVGHTCTGQDMYGWIIACAREHCATQITFTCGGAWQTSGHSINCESRSPGHSMR
jgi:hypothetical protein